MLMMYSFQAIDDTDSFSLPEYCLVIVTSNASIVECSSISLTMTFWFKFLRLFVVVLDLYVFGYLFLYYCWVLGDICRY